MSKLHKDFFYSVNLNANTDFPYLVLDVINGRSYPQTPAFKIMHWHDDLQFIYVLSGTIRLQTLEANLLLAAGEGLFVNQKVLHRVQKVEEAHYKTFRFPDYFLSFYAGSPAKQFVDRVLAAEQLSLCHFVKGQDWCNEILAIMQQLSLLENEQHDFYVYEVLVLLTRIWLLMLKNIQLPASHEKSLTNIRMQKFLRYIEANYAENIALADLAASANVSKSECLRCFKSSMQTTPYKYLLEYRLAQAARLLKTSTDKIENIANAVGFHQLSHFGQCFKQKTGFSPKEYRLRDNNDYE